MPAYTFGFAVGRFSEVSDRESGVTLQYFADGFSPDEIRAIFGESRQILRFFEERSGVPYPWADIRAGAGREDRRAGDGGIVARIGGVRPGGSRGSNSDRAARARILASVVGGTW
jgi:hypothetical protein